MTRGSNQVVNSPQRHKGQREEALNQNFVTSVPLW